MDESDDVQASAPPAATGHASATAVTLSHAKSGPQLLHELLAIVYHVLEEAKYMNLKPPLQPSSRLFSLDALSTAPGSPGPPESPTDDHTDYSDGAAAFGAGHGHGAGNHQPVIPYTPEEIQDSYTKIAHLKNQYVRMSNELLETIKRVESGATSSNKVRRALAVLSMCECEVRWRSQSCLCLCRRQWRSSCSDGTSCGGCAILLCSDGSEERAE